MGSLVEHVPEAWRQHLDLSGQAPKLSPGALIAWFREVYPLWGVRFAIERLASLGCEVVRCELTDEEGAIRASAYALLPDMTSLRSAQSDALTMAIQFAGVGALLFSPVEGGGVYSDVVAAKEFGVSRTFDDVAQRFAKLDSIAEAMGGGPRRARFLWATYRRFEIALPGDPLAALEEFMEAAQRDGLRYAELPAFASHWLRRKISGAQGSDMEGIVGREALLRAIKAEEREDSD